MSAKPPRPAASGPFFDALKLELESRARMLLSGQSRSREGQSSADDLVQETLVRLLQSYDEASLRERPHNQLMALAWRTMRNILIDESRKKAALLEDTKPDEQNKSRSLATRADDSHVAVDESLTTTQRHEAVRRQLERLAPEERCFLSTVLETDSVPAAQKHCGWPPKSPYYVLKKLLDKLKLELAEWSPG